jgi:glycosyltransferase involved in cell wall biosynthesis
MELARSRDQRTGSPASADPERSLRVLLLTSSLHYGGAERQVVELARRLDRRRFQPFLCCLDGTRTEFDLAPSPTPLAMARRRARFDPIPFLRVGWLLRRWSIDIVHAFLFDAEMIGRLMGWLTRVPVIIASERNSDYRPMPLQDRAQRLTRPLVDLMVANSHAGRRYAIQHLGFAPDRVAVVHNGVDTVRFAPGDKAEARARLGLPDRGPVVGMFASFKPQKNHAMYFRAARRILDRQPEARFLSVSHVPWQPWNGAVNADYQASLRALVDQLGLRERMVILTNRDDVDRLYAACDVTVLTSRREGTPNVVLESMASGVPVVATDVADNALILDDTSGGAVVPVDADDLLAERVCALVSDPGALGAAGTRARRAALERFSMARCVAAIGSLYEQTWARKARRAPARRIVASRP